MRYFTVVFSALFLFLIAFLNVEAAILMVNKNESPGQGGKISISKAYIDKIGMRIESDENMDSIMIYRKDKDVLWIIDKNDKSYMEMTRADVKEMKNQMDIAMKKLEEQMKSMPPEQRAMMEKMMQGRTAMQPKKTTYKKVASGLKVNNWVCNKYEGYLEGVKKKEICTTDWKKLGITSKYLDVMHGLSEFLSEFTGEKSSFFRMGSKEWEKEQGYSGLPVKSISYSQGNIKNISELQEITKKDVPASFFDLPKGLIKKENPSIKR